jgi:osmoprotectant transport system ATP-binding protein
VIQQIGLFPHQTIGDNIATVPKLLGWDKERIRARVDELLELSGSTRRTRATATPRSSPAASASASAWPARSPPTRR